MLTTGYLSSRDSKPPDIPAIDVDQGLAFFLAHNFERASECSRKFLRCMHDFAMPPTRLGKHFVCGLDAETSEREIFGANGPALWVHTARRHLRGVPPTVVADDEQDRQVVHGGHHVTGTGDTKDLGPITND